jgi:hypothetical protein
MTASTRDAVHDDIGAELEGLLEGSGEGIVDHQGAPRARPRQWRRCRRSAAAGWSATRSTSFVRSGTERRRGIEQIDRRMAHPSGRKTFVRDDRSAVDVDWDDDFISGEPGLSNGELGRQAERILLRGSAFEIGENRFGRARVGLFVRE